MEFLSYIKNRLPHSLPEHSRVYNLTGSSAALLLAFEERPFIAIEDDEAKAETLQKDINFYRRMFGGRETLFLPDPEGPGEAGIRAQLLFFIKDSDSLITSSRNLYSPLWDRVALVGNTVRVKKGELLMRGNFEESLIRMGYTQAAMVAEKGEYSRRGWIVDVFPSTSTDPLRIEFFGDEIEQVKTFDIDTQRSKDSVAEFLLFPASAAAEPTSLAEIFPERLFYCLYPRGQEDWLPENAIFLSRYSFDASDGGSGQDGADHAPATTVEGIEAGVLSMKGLGILPEERKGLDLLPDRLRTLSSGSRIVIVASSSGQSERLRDIFRDKVMVVPMVDLREVKDFEGRISITEGDLSSGMGLEGLFILTEKEIFGERPRFRPIKRSRLANLLMSIDDVMPGDFIVHRDHGIGRFSGVVRQMMEGNELELMLIEYEGGRIYIPIQNIQTISKYRSEEGITPRLDRLGGKTWQRKKERARKNVHAIAERLIALYADRNVSRGYSFSPDDALHREFDGFFSYEETADQMKAISDIKRDMESDKPMDRLLCGDVGYGKTEVAMRAAFKAVYDNRQVAVLVPTTILAEQHYRTFKERFSGFPVTIDYLSRFRTRKETELALKGLARGETDIVIGTHGLLSKRIVFSRLGLLIVDEEHRFGVGQKEKIKELSRNIDVLNLTATPIPRTLHMALSGIREISIIETPPEERLAVKSVVSLFSDSLIRDAIVRELHRNGQVFFVHNRIQDIQKIARHLKELIPSAEIGVAHGRMAERELERVMHRFFEGEVNVLVSTAIVGSGLDIPRANTIIIDMADKMGLADLYQLRGRVGRSSLKGYAIFLAPPEDSLTEEARKRLQAVQEMSYLGAGFRLALKDLEIRGAGDIFGPEQSGHIHEIGFDLYIEMLEKAVAELKGTEIRDEPEPVIGLKTSAFIPEEYIEEVTLRLSFYRRMASLKSEKEVEAFGEELRDRFGNPPPEAINLLDVVKLKILARTLSITKVQELDGRLQVLFSADTAIQPDDIFSLHDTRKGAVRFLPDGFELGVKGLDREGVFEELYRALKDLCDRTGCYKDA